MHLNDNSVSKTLVLFFVVLNAVVVEQAYVSNQNWYWALFITIPILWFMFRRIEA